MDEIRHEEQDGEQAKPKAPGGVGDTVTTHMSAFCQSGVCPLTMLPADTLVRLIKRPFRKRHPIIFWGAVLLLLVIIIPPLLLWGGDDEANTDSIALVNITGPIMNIEPNLEWIRRIAHNPLVKGVLVRVDSPGGGASASEELYAALLNLGGKKPIAVSMGSFAASGGLMVSMAGQRIFANPATLTGSIGVRMDIPQIQGLMDKLGIGQETLVSGPYKDAASISRPLTERDRIYLQGLISSLHEQFIGIIAERRHLDKEQATAIANGKVYLGSEALKLGLIDAIGGQDDALAWLSEQTQVPVTRKLLKRPSSKAKLLEQLLEKSQILGLEKAIAMLLSTFGKVTDSAASLANGEKAGTPLILY